MEGAFLRASIFLFGRLLLGGFWNSLKSAAGIIRLVVKRTIVQLLIVNNKYS